MADDKVANQALIRPRPPIELRDLALASFYPRTQSPTPLRANNPEVPSLQKRQRDNLRPPDNVAKPWKKPWDK